MTALPAAPPAKEPLARRSRSRLDRLAFRGGAQARRAARALGQARGRCSRPATARRACRISAPSARWRAPPWCGTPSACSTGRHGADAPHRLLRRHGRPAQGPGQRPQQGDAGARISASRSRECPTRSARTRASATTTTRGCAPSSTQFGFDYEFLSATDCYRAGRFDATLLAHAAALRRGHGDHAAVAARGAGRRPIRPSCRSTRRPATSCRCPSTR